ncbi:MAG: cell division protein FtsA [Candidatus Pacebacteria bacterium CG10_big_fil_rev_8_21_14_0_10_44_11]|nr:MAG: cell division protein FtsA [Candidatus Pacebacteria bacterium CG10_big_fil_rev_8_21_14_0_10_44_11]
MPQEMIITAIDLGTDKCVTLIAKQEPGQKNPSVLGVCAVPSKGMRRSQIIDLEQVLETINESLDGAERMAGLEVKQAYLSVGGTHIASLNSKGVVAVASPEQEITAEDVNRVIEAARAISMPSDKEIIHVIPNTYKVDSQEGIKDPIGMTGIRLESETHIITAMSTALKNIEKCVEDLGIGVSGFVFSGLAAAEVVLSETEKELGVALVDIGAGSSSICAYVDGALVYSASIPIGARHITQDIALGCRVSLDIAEKLKLQLSQEKNTPMKPHPGESKQDFSKRCKKADEIDLSELTNGESTEVLSKDEIIEGIMFPRMEEIFNLVNEKLSAQDLLHNIPAGVVLTGGGAETVGIIEVAKDTLKLSARIGKPLELAGLTSDIQKPGYATSIGLLFYGRHEGGETINKSFALPSFKLPGSPGKLISKILDLFKSLLP